MHIQSHIVVQSDSIAEPYEEAEEVDDDDEVGGGASSTPAFESAPVSKSQS